MLRISAVWYPVRQWEEAKRFYGEVLGLPAGGADDAGGWAWFRTGHAGLPLFLVRRPEEAGAAGGGVVTFNCPGLDAFLDRLRRSGVAIDPEAGDASGVRVVTIRDPDGNRIELAEDSG